MNWADAGLDPGICSMRRASLGFIGVSQTTVAAGCSTFLPRP